MFPRAAEITVSQTQKPTLSSRCLELSDNFTTNFSARYSLKKIKKTVIMQNMSHYPHFCPYLILKPATADQDGCIDFSLPCYSSPTGIWQLAGLMSTAHMAACLICGWDSGSVQTNRLIYCRGCRKPKPRERYPQVPCGKAWHSPVVAEPNDCARNAKIRGAHFCVTSR